MTTEHIYRKILTIEFCTFCAWLIYQCDIFITMNETSLIHLLLNKLHAFFHISLCFFLMPIFCLRILSKTTSHQVTMVPYSPVAYCSFKDFSASTNLSSLKCLQHSQLQFVYYIFMAICRSLCFWRKGTEMTSHSCHIISIVGTLCEITPPALVCYVSSGFYILKPLLSLLTLWKDVSIHRANSLVR